MNLIFKNINETTKVLEDGLCDWRQFGFQKYEGNIDFLGTTEWKTGKAIEIFIAKENFMRHEIQGGRKFYKKYKKEAYHALEFKPEFQRFAELNLQNVAKKVSKGKKKKYLTKTSSEIQSQYLKNRHLKQILNTTVGFYLGTNGNDRSNLTKKKQD